MLVQVTLVVLAALAACHSYPTTNQAYHRSPQQLLLPQSLPLPARPLFPADVSPLNVQRLTQARLPLSASGQYLLYYPGVPGSAPVVYAVRNNGTEGQEEGGGGTLSAIYNFFTGFWETSSVKPVEEATPEKEPSKVSDGEVSTAAPSSANLESFDEDDHKEPTSPSPIVPKQPEPEHKLFLIGQPQFFGNYDALKNPEIIKELGNKNPFPNILMTNNQQPFVWQGEFPPPGYGAPGKAATEFQKIQEAAKLNQTGGSGTETDAGLIRRAIAAEKPTVESDSVVVEALRLLPNVASSEEDEAVEAVDESEPSVAQVRPQAIALAGPSGVAAAAPVGTAVVGRGGLAVAAPSATAVAGPSGGEPPLIAPANRVAQQAFLAAHGQSRFLERADDIDDYNEAA